MGVDTSNSVIGRVRLSTRSDERLLARARQGDARCFDELHRRYRSSVFGYCLMRLIDRQAAEDATQEVFLKVSQASGASIENTRAWLFAIARNVVIDAARRVSSAPAFAELESVLDSAAHSEDETAFSALDVTANVYIALRQLPTRERQAFIHREFHDWTSQRIADELDMRPSNVDVLMCRARAAFGRAYAEVADLPFACRQTTETIYRELGSGASDRGLQLMRAHLAVCPRCHAERQRARSPRFVGAIVPWLWLGTQTRAMAQVGNRIGTSLVTAGARMNQAILPTWSGPAKAVVAVAIAATATALVPALTRYDAAEPTIEPASAKTARSAMFSSSSAWDLSGATRRELHDGTDAYRGDLAHEMAVLHAENHSMTSESDAAHDGTPAVHDAHVSGSGSTTTKHRSDAADTGTAHTTDPGGGTDADSGHSSGDGTEPHMSDGVDPAP